MNVDLTTRQLSPIANRRTLIAMTTILVFVVAGAIVGFALSIDSNTDADWITPVYGISVVSGVAGLILLLRAAIDRTNRLIEARRLALELREDAAGHSIGRPMILSKARILLENLLEAGELEEAAALGDAMVEYERFVQEASP